VHNPEKVFYGRLPGFGLDGPGREQARRAGLALRGKHLAAVFSSPLLRARQTARALLACYPALQLRLSGLLTEVYSSYEGGPQAAVNALKDDIYTGAAPEFEQPREIVARSLKFMRRVRRQFAGGHVAAVTHGDVIAFLILWAKDMPLTGENKLRLSRTGVLDGYPAHGSITTLAFSTLSPDERPEVRYVNPA
jgi:broad specificity phosphatase PhoE